MGKAWKEAYPDEEFDYCFPDDAVAMPVSWWILALAGATAMVVALLTMGFQAIKAARANPVKNLRTE